MTTVAPNMRVQRTRSSPSALREPLTLHPLGTWSAIRRGSAIVGLFCVASLCAAQGKAPSLAAGSARYESAHPGVKKIGGSVIAPVLIARVDPEVPKDLKEKGRNLTPIILEAVISETGDVVDPVVLSTDNADLHPYAVAAVRKWKYRPAQEDGKAVAAFVMISIQLHEPRA